MNLEKIARRSRIFDRDIATMQGRTGSRFACCAGIQL